jgi:hypothetical protein
MTRAPAGRAGERTLPDRNPRFRSIKQSWAARVHRRVATGDPNSGINAGLSVGRLREWTRSCSEPISGCSPAASRVGFEFRGGEFPGHGAIDAEGCCPALLRAARRSTNHDGSGNDQCRRLTVIVRHGHARSFVVHPGHGAPLVGFVVISGYTTSGAFDVKMTFRKAVARVGTADEVARSAGEKPRRIRRKSGRRATYRSARLLAPCRHR